MNLNKLDKIILKDKEDLDKLFRWRDNNKELVRKFKPSLNEGLIVFGEYKQYFNQVENFIDYKVWFSERLVMSLEIENIGNQYQVIEVSSEFDKDTQASYIQDCVTTHASLMAYMAHYTEYITEKRERVIKKKKSKGNSKSKPKDKVIKLGKKIYNVSVPDSVTTEKRVYTKHVESFAVTGHQRTYKKTGKTVWIKGYVKGKKGADPKPRTFKM